MLDIPEPYNYDIMSRSLTVAEVQELVRWLRLLSQNDWYQVKPGDITPIPPGCYRLLFAKKEHAVIFTLKWS